MRSRNLILGTLVVVVISALLLYAAWALEEAKKSVRTVVIKNPSGNDLFVVELQEKQEGDILIQCNEERFQDAFGHFRKFLGVDTEPVAVPGGAMLLALPPTEVPEDLQPAKRVLVEVLKRHSPRRVILIAHSECLLYDVLAAWQDRLDEVKGRQETDLRRATDTIKTWFPNTEVDVFYAQKDGDKLLFNPLPP